MLICCGKWGEGVGGKEWIWWNLRQGVGGWAQAGRGGQYRRSMALVQSRGQYRCDTETVPHNAARCLSERYCPLLVTVPPYHGTAPQATTAPTRPPTEVGSPTAFQPLPPPRPTYLSTTPLHCTAISAHFSISFPSTDFLIRSNSSCSSPLRLRADILFTTSSISRISKLSIAP